MAYAYNNVGVAKKIMKGFATPAAPTPKSAVEKKFPLCTTGVVPVR
jgi:hypothetical protein